MGLFRKRETVDLTRKYPVKNRLQNVKAGSSTENQPASGSFGFLANLASSSAQSPAYTDTSDGENPEEKRRKLAKRLMDLTEKIEDLSTQIYHLQQRVELLERKNRTGFE